MEIKNIARCAFMAVSDPSLLTIDFEQSDRRYKELVKQREKEAPQPTTADFRKEYNQLRQRLFDLQQNAKSFEIRTNEAAGKIRLLEQRINETLKLKKAAAEAGNLLGERTYERAVAKLETELLDVKEDFDKNRRWSSQAARALKEFNQHDRIEELKALLDEPLPVAKTNK